MGEEMTKNEEDNVDGNNEAANIRQEIKYS